MSLEEQKKRAAIVRAERNKEVEAERAKMAATLARTGMKFESGGYSKNPKKAAMQKELYAKREKLQDLRRIWDMNRSAPVTITAQERVKLFGEIRDLEVELRKLEDMIRDFKI